MMLGDELNGLKLKPAVSPPPAPRMDPRRDTDHLISNALRAIENEARVYSASIALMELSAAEDQAYLDRIIKFRNDARSDTGEMDDTARARSHVLLGSSTLWRDWQFMAARSGVLAARNLQEALISLSWRVRDSALSLEIDQRSLSRLRKELRKLFPGLRHVRDSVAHPEEYNRDNVDTTGGLKAGTMKDCLSAGEYRATFRGQYLRCALSQEHAAAVCSIVAETFSAFESLTLDAYLGQMQVNARPYDSIA